VCKLQDLFSKVNPIAGFGGLNFVFLVILTELIAKVNKLFTEHKLIIKHF
jgi:hypothetical protein